jgi:hypothetical protein
MNTARKALRESRTISLRRSLEGTAASHGSSFREGGTDLEAGGSFLEEPLLEGEHEGHDEPPRQSMTAAAAAAVAAVDVGESGSGPLQSRLSQGTSPRASAAAVGPRDSRTLWRLARTKLGAPLLPAVWTGRCCADVKAFTMHANSSCPFPLPHPHLFYFCLLPPISPQSSTPACRAGPPAGRN